ncbi:TIGR00375 family protein [Bacillus haynesii]|uniref:TIGR00375 family protein n=1 Tax=Bacillus haynesii TaxID=1925021 RepID=UPI002281D3A5|nr:TIGR00375 family protein [Bacillus haynesii]MCY8100110.1 TIGR00375 family protein [Bacillus haynesii]MCY8469473.1 TIGR00375 family protein [Bacillus haynesii]
MKEIFADMHIHIGRTESGRPVKITAARTLTLDEILIEASEHKGMELIGIIDCHSPEVLAEIEKGVSSGRYTELEDGGIKYKDTVLLCGSELEINDDRCRGPIHVLAFMPSISAMKQFSGWLSERVTNIHLSSQRIYETGIGLQRKVKELGGLFIPAHIFTPHKSLYGKGVKFSLQEVFDPKMIDAVELGLSSDTDMASHVSELNPYAFLTNSDAHSLGKIGREYNKLHIKHASFQEFSLALKGQEGRCIAANYGMNPQLGKYFQTACERCGRLQEADETVCKACGSRKFTKGVSMRLMELYDQDESPVKRPPYVHQVPLQLIPGIGPKTIQKLKEAFGTEMNILHRIKEGDLKETIRPQTAELVIKARNGDLELKAGGGGTYGKVQS